MSTVIHKENRYRIYRKGNEKRIKTFQYTKQTNTQKINNTENEGQKSYYTYREQIQK